MSYYTQHDGLSFKPGSRFSFARYSKNILFTDGTMYEIIAKRDLSDSNHLIAIRYRVQYHGILKYVLFRYTTEHNHVCVVKEIIRIHDGISSTTWRSIKRRIVTELEAYKG